MTISFYLCGQNVTEPSAEESLSNKPSTNLVKIRIPNDVTYSLQAEETYKSTNNDESEEGIEKSTPKLTSYDLSYNNSLSDFYPTFIRKISCGSDFLVVLLNDGSLYSMGANAHGQLGINLSNFSINTFSNKKLVRVKHSNLKAKLVECGAHFTLFATEDNRLFGFGTNDYNQIYYERVDPNENGDCRDFIEPFEIDYHRNEGQDEITHLSCCFSFSMFVLNNRELRMIGQNWVCQHGHANLIGSRHVPFKTLYKFNENIKKISAGGFHFVILLENGQLFGAGDHASKQYGSYTDSQLPDDEIFIDIGKKYFPRVNFPPIKDVVCGGDSTVVQLEDGSVYFCGINNMNQFIQNFRQVEEMTPIHYNDNIIKLYSGEDFSCAISVDGKCILRGNNDKTQLGCPERSSIEHTLKLSELFSSKELKNLDEIHMACGYYNTVIYRKPSHDIADHFPLLFNSRKHLHDIQVNH